MKDKELKFWTTNPNIFLVAETESGKIAGCIAYRQLTENTIEMHRVNVDLNYRRLGDQSFTSLMADLSRDINRVSSFSRCLNGTNP